MSDLQPKGKKIKLGNNEYGMRFTLNAIDDIQDHFNIPISQLGELFSNERDQIKSIRYVLTVLINEDIDCLNDESDVKINKLDEKYVGRHMDIQNITMITSAIFGSFADGALESDDEIPNAVSE